MKIVLTIFALSAISLFRASDIHGAELRSLLPGSELTIDTTCAVSDVIAVGSITSNGHEDREDRSSIYYPSVKITTDSTLKGDISDIQSFTYARQNLSLGDYEEKPTLNAKYIFFIHRKWKPQSNIDKILPATVENLAKVKSLLHDTTLPVNLRGHRIDILTAIQQSTNIIVAKFTLIDSHNISQSVNFTQYNITKIKISSNLKGNLPEECNLSFDIMTKNRKKEECIPPLLSKDYIIFIRDPILNHHFASAIVPCTDKLLNEIKSTMTGLQH